MYIKLKGNFYEISKLTLKDYLKLSVSGTVGSFEKLTGKKVKIKKVLGKKYVDKKATENKKEGGK